MNILGVGGAEFVLILLIMIVVAGPKRMIRWSYVLGVYTGKLRDMWREVAQVLQQEVDAAGIDYKVPENIPTKQQLVGSVNEFAQKAVQPVQQPLTELQAELQQVQAEGKSVLERDFKADELSSQPMPPQASQNGTTDNQGSFGTWSQT